jgi:ElaB/YqjD/DUF883 family membrane-anchored ribosome-binding protein
MTLSAQKDSIVNELRGVLADAEELLRNTSGDVSSTASEARHRIEARLTQVRSSLAHLQDASVEKVKAAGHAADDYVHDHPWKAVGAGVGIGLILGLLIGRR